MANWLFDAGHGGSDPGAAYGDRQEKNDVLKMVLEVANILKANGESVDFTRTSDATLSLNDRSNKDNAGNYDYFVSFHRNAIAPEKAYGVETYIYNGSFASKETCRSLATKVNTEIAGCGFYNRGVKEANFHVLRETKSNAILMEIGFIDNSNDNALFDSKFDSIAKGIAKGCLAQVGKSLDESTPTPPPSGEMYRVRKTWADAASQKGAFSDLNNAKKCADENPGHYVFNSNGVSVYPAALENIDVIYQLYSGGRWLPNVKNLDDYAGIYGQAAQAVYTNLSKGSIKYRVHTTTGRWLPFVTDRTDYAGMYGTNIDGIEFELAGLPGYSVKYRTYSKGRWLPWVIDRTDYAGIFGEAIEGLQVQVVKK